MNRVKWGRIWKDIISKYNVTSFDYTSVFKIPYSVPITVGEVRQEQRGPTLWVELPAVSLRYLVPHKTTKGMKVCVINNWEVADRIWGLESCGCMTGDRVDGENNMTQRINQEVFREMSTGKTATHTIAQSEICTLSNAVELGGVGRARLMDNTVLKEISTKLS